MNWLVDTNVLVVADDRGTSAPPGCVIAAIDIIDSIRAGQPVVIDAAGEILAEYLNNVSVWTAQPGYGAAFAKWLYDNQAIASICTQVPITSETSNRSFMEVPQDIKRLGFDPADHKFFAVALAHGDCQLAEAADSEWWHHRSALRDAGLKVVFICAEWVKEVAERKYGKEA